ncbi:MAG TPA: DNA helicase RecQ [Phycisphaerales bacterium]|nr:DNA helicase RecQ [Phycisphaerales bacterium]
MQGITVEKALSTYWGYDRFLPLQEQAMAAIVRRRDCIVVLPTGGGKSLCYQAPAVTAEGTAVVVSPLISLMKDQVDALTECGVAAGRLDSSLAPHEQQATMEALKAGRLKLLYVAPERLVTDAFVEMLRKIRLSFVAVDEAHCVSMWGHDFRPEYRRLGSLKKLFPGIPVGAYTATATEHVRADIAEQLNLEQPTLLIGSFDRANLVYRVFHRGDILKQVRGVLDRHKGESGIIYCIRRKDVDSMCAQLKALGYRVAPYHAGMEDEDRKRNQDRFIKEEVDVIVATIAFGMGIDKSNVRFVVHTGMPKSLEHYQQESGRAGRDGLEAECCLFYGGGDFGTWKFLMKDMPDEAREIATAKLGDMYNYCTGGLCRHRSLVRYFGQDLDGDDCQACDICLGDRECIEDALVTAQKILSCILRLEQRFGAGYTTLVLTGSQEQKIIESGHDRLTTYGLLSDRPRSVVRDWIEQLVGQGCIAKAGEFSVLNITPRGWEVVRGTRTPRLFKPPEKPLKKSKAAAQSWEGVDKGLFEVLRKIRAEIASRKGVPAFVIFGDTTLRDMARRRPATLDDMLWVSGVGKTKQRQYGKVFLEAIADYCRRHANSLNAEDASGEARRKRDEGRQTRPSSIVRSPSGSGVSAISAASMPSRQSSDPRPNLPPARYPQPPQIGTGRRTGFKPTSHRRRHGKP